MASYQAQHIQFENWAPQEVANWLQGLDESVAQYVPLFKINEVDGRRLLMLNHSDLEKMGIKKLGHQELVLEAVDLLRSLRYTLDTENLQSMALQLGCKARNVVAEIQMRQGENDQNRANLRYGELHRRRLSVTVLSYVADLLTTLKNLVSWLDRAPFEGIYDICRLRNSVVKLGLELVTVTQRESACVDPEGAIKKSCGTLIEYCEGLVQNTKDPLVIQPAALEQATIRKKQGEELGMNIQSAYNGIHGISSIKDLSPADMCSKIEKGDEVLQVNGQTVLGWQLKELVKILKDKPKEVTLLLKKRPRHVNPLGAMQNHKKLAAKHAQQAVTLPKSLKKRRSREGEALKQGRPSLQEFVVVSAAGESVYITKDTSDTNDADGNDTDNDVFRSGSDSPQYTLPVMPDAKQRRATVSGGSPTFERNSLMVDDPVIRPKTQALNKVHREATLAVLTASENNLKSRVGAGEEEGLPKGEAVWRKTSSESSSGQKGPSESEMEDSVFSSDKEDKDQQTSKKPSPEKEHQQFRVTRPTPILLEPTADPTPPSKSPLRRTSSSSSSVSSTTSSSTLINSPHTAPKLRGTDTAGKLKAPESLPRTSSPTSSPNVAHGPAEQHTANKKHSSSNARSPAAPRKRSFTSMFTRDSSHKASNKSKPASDSGKKTSGDSSKKTEKEKKNSTESRSGKISSECERKTSAACDSGQKTHTVMGKGEKTEIVRDGGRGTSPVGNSVKQSSAIREGENNSRVSEPADEVNHVAEVMRNVEARSTADSSRRIPHQEPSLADNTGNRTESASDLDVDKSVKDCISAPSEVSDSKSQSYTVTPDTPVAVEAASEGSRVVHSEVATEVEDSSMPQLIRVTKLATEAPSPYAMKASDDIPKGGSPKVEAPKEDAVPTEPPVVDAVKVKKHVEFSPQTKETSSSEDLSSTHGAVGGRTQLSLGEKSVSGSTEWVRMRHKSSTRRAADRRVSCKDLGQGDCEGWLYKKKEKDRTLSRQWHKRWCVLKSYNLYYYKNKEELRAEGVIYMPAFQVSPAPGQKSKKFAFRIHNSGTTFYFASERQDDMSKWMNKMGLAAISFNTSTVTNIGSFARPEPRCQHLEVPCNMYYSESDEDPEETPVLLAGSTPSLLSMEHFSSTTSPSPPILRRGMVAVPSDPRVPARGQGSGSLMESGVHGQKAAAASVKETSGDDLHTVLRAIHSQDLTIDGVDRRKRRTRHLSSIMGAADGKTDANVAKLRKLLALKRTLKVREQELQDIERLLESHPTPTRLRDFVYRHPDLRL